MGEPSDNATKRSDQGSMSHIVAAGESAEGSHRQL